MSDDFRTLLPVDHRELVAGIRSLRMHRRWRRCTQLHHVSIPSADTIHPKEKLQLRVRSSRRRKALLQLFLALGERCTDGATARSHNGDQDRDRGRPVLFVRPVRVVPVTSSNLAILEKKLSPRVRLHTLWRTAAWSCMERSSGRRTTIRVFLPPTLFDEPATAVTMRRSPTSSGQRVDLQTRRAPLSVGGAKSK